MAKYSGMSNDGQSQYGGNQGGYAQTVNEQDLIRSLVDGSDGKQSLLDQQTKLCIRIWSGYTKFIRSQCNKDRIIDSLYFGSFFMKNSVPSQLGAEVEKSGVPGNTYALVHDSKKVQTFAEFKCTQNGENFYKIPQLAAGKDEVQVNIKAIAQVCNCQGEQISSFLARLRETAFQTAFMKKKTVNLNFSIGQLCIYPNQTFEFKSIGYYDNASQMAAPVPSSIGDVRSQYLGDTQSQAGDRRRSQHANTQQTSKSKIASLLKKDEEGQNYSHLSDFLKSHIYRGTEKVNHNKLKSIDDDQFSHISKKNKYSNALIEKASLEVREKRNRDNKSAVKRATSYGNSEQNLNSAFVLNQQQIDQDNGVHNTFREYADPNTLSEKKSSIQQSRIAGSYLSNRLSRQRGGRSMAAQTTNPSEKDAQSVVSLASRHSRGGMNSQRGKRNALSSRKFSQNQTTTVPSYDPPPQNVSKSQKDMNRFYQTANNLLSQKKGQSKFADGTIQNNSTLHNTGDDVRTIIGLALNRKQVSANYHSQAYPYFMRSQGPFKVYDHAQHKGQQYVHNINEINNLAHQRFQDECMKIKDSREYEREQFNWQKQKQDLIAVHKAELRKKNNLENLRFLAKQIQSDRETKSHTNQVERLYYKPHFGPEETDQMLDMEDHRRATTTAFVNSQLLDQINLKNNMKLNDFHSERFGDLTNLKTAQNMFVTEEMARQDKVMNEKLANKQNWESQIRDRQLKDQVDKLFY